MISKLTPSQEKQIPEYINKWVSKASEKMDHKKAIEYTRKLYKNMGEKEPLIIFGFSPYNTALLCSLFWTLAKEKKLPITASQLHSQLHSQLDSQLHSQLDSQLDSQLRSQLRSQLQSINSYWYLGMFWLVWCGWYDYGKSIGVKFDEEKYDLFMNFNSEVNFIIPYKNVAFISEKPVEVNWRNQRLHKDGGMSVRYSDGWGIHTLNGVKVSKEIAETPKQELKSEILLKEDNAQVRSEIIKKIGYSRILKDLKAKQLDAWREYELYRIDEGDVEPMVLLKYACPSTGAYYAHRVPPQMNKAREAMAWANHGVDPEEFLVET